jgi:hypothetical protein
MIRIKEVLILNDAVKDLEEGRAFYEMIENRVGDYFWDCLLSDIESLILYAGIHTKQFSVYKMLSKRFPYAIYYEILGDNAFVIGVLPMRRDPAWIKLKMTKRK